MSKLQMELQETPIMGPCPDCLGDGEVEVDVPRPHAGGFNEGYVDTVWEVCETCNGDGELARLCDCGEPVTKIMGQDAEVCMECQKDWGDAV